MKKGVFFTLDAVLAFLLVVSLVFVFSSFVATFPSFDGDLLLSALTQYSGEINTTSLQALVREHQYDGVCLNASVFSMSGTLVMSTTSLKCLNLSMSRLAYSSIGYNGTTPVLLEVRAWR